MKTKIKATTEAVNSTLSHIESGLTPDRVISLSKEIKGIRGNANLAKGLAPVFADLLSLLAMLRDVVTKRYPAPWTVALKIAACVTYVLSPFDILTNFIPVVGWTDDMLAIALCHSSLQREIDAYEEAKKRN